ncbi:MAG: histidine phosphatase family protein [Hyphomonadaceae bacterium]|nr:histidine phosphatase family protein [Clostridia bacterium]
MSTKIFIVRHGEATGNIDRVFHGQSNSELTENGHLQAKIVATRLAHEKIDAIYASDLTRAITTAQYIAREHHLEVQIDARLKEINGGDWENQTFAEISIKWAQIFDDFQHKPLTAQLPNGESVLALRQRGIEAISEIVCKHPNQTVCIVTHGTMIRALLTYYLKLGDDQMSQLAWHDNASISNLIFDEDECEVLYHGDNQHLGELSTLSKQDWWKKFEGGDNHDHK